MNDLPNNLPPDDVILVFIRQVCEHKPRLLPQIIQQATLGVQEFANKQTDFGSKMGFMMTQILDTTTQDKFGPFTRKDVFESTRPWLEGTTWWKENVEKMIDNKP